MRKILVGILFVVTYVFVSPSLVFAQNSCPHQSTQARVQNNINSRWDNNIQVGCERSFNVGSFHDNTGQFADDTWLYVYGPGNFGAYFRNGQTVEVSQNGTYYLNVTTGANINPGCTDSAVVTVSCQENENMCPYGSTEARVQKSIDDPWRESLEITCGERFNVGSFHDNTGQFATDTKLHVEGPRVLFVPRLNHDFSNGDSIRAWFPGVYTLFVTTPGKNGASCEQKAKVQVKCPRIWWQ